MRYFLAALCAILISDAGVASAQSATRSPRGNADREMERLRSSSIGTGYTSGSINNAIIQRSLGLASSNVNSAASSVSSGAPVSSRVSAPSAPRPAAKPFTNLNKGSTLSPYLGLFNEGLAGDTVDNYNAFVRPRMQQQQFNSAVSRQQQQLNVKVQSISARPAFQQQGSEQMMPTGHQATFGYYSRFYPGLNRRR